MNHIEDDWNSLSDETELEILSEHAKLAKLLSFLYISKCVHVYVSMFFIKYLL